MQPPNRELFAPRDLFAPPIQGNLRSWFTPDNYQNANGYTLVEISEGDAGTGQTISAMVEKAREGAHHPGIRVAAERAVKLAGVAPKDYAGELRALYSYVKTNVRYSLDPRGKEQVAGPAWTLFVSGTGDCDDVATLLVAMAGAMGHGGAFRTVKADPSRPQEYSHVYPVLGFRAADGVHWFPADVTQLNTDFGWEPPRERVFELRDWVAIPP